MSVSSSLVAPRKRFVRSVFDPLPRSLSIRSLAVLVTMLVAGIAISVHEYLESGKAPEHRHSIRTVSDQVCPLPRIEAGSPARPGMAPFSIEPSAAHRTSAREPSIGTGANPTFTPGVCVPDSESKDS